MAVVSALVHVISLLAVAATLLAACLFLVDRIAERISEARRAADINEALSLIQTLDRWCCHDFPIIEDAAKWLSDGIRPEPGTGRPDIAEFRDKLRAKYGRRPTVQEASR